MENTGFIDIHTHILPGIDDGARDLAESLLIVKEAIVIGVREIILSPHLPYYGANLDKVSQSFQSFREVVTTEELPVKLHLGPELMLSFELPQLICADKRFTINGYGRYALIEMPCFEIPVYAPDVFFGLLTRGVTPILAHPERCLDVIRNYRQVSRFIDNGVMIQVNAGSILGKYGRKVRSTAISLLKAGFCHVVASDTHRSGVIKTLLPEAFSFLGKIIGQARAEELIFSNPAKLVR